MTEPLLEAVNVTKDLGSGAARVAALKGVTLSLKGGELNLRRWGLPGAARPRSCPFLDAC